MRKLSIFFILALATLSQAAEPPVCPVMHGKTPADAISTTYRGLLVRFCCAGCDHEFLNAPEKYLTESAEKGLVVAEALFSPISGKRVSEPKFSSDYRGTRYPFLSADEKKEFEDAPELHTLAPDKEVLTCPVMGNKLKSHAEASGYVDHAGVRYYFCCDGCDTQFLAEPEKFAKAAAKHVRPVSTTQKVESGTKIAPTCAGCAGEARLIGADGKLPYRWTVAYRFVNAPGLVPARHRFTLDYAVTPRLTVGIERSGSDSSRHKTNLAGPANYLKNSDGDALLMPRLNWFVTPEGKNHPSLVFGFISDRLSTDHGMAFFATSSKSIKGLPVMPFVSVKYSNHNGRVVFPFGGNLNLRKDLVLQTIHDGDYTHMLLTKIGKKGTTSLLFARMKYIGMSWSVGF